MAYRVFILPGAVKSLKRIPQPDRLRISRRIDQLSLEPRPPGAVKLQGEMDLHRLRAGDYRIIYRIDGDKLIILVVRIGHRKDVYKKLQK